MRFLLKFQFLVILGTILLSQRAEAQQVALKLQLKWNHQFQFAGYYAAKINGYYEAEGIDLEILEGGKNISPIDIINSGKADFSIFDPEILFKSSKNHPLVATFATLQSTPYGVFSLPESNIRRPSDLVGKKVMASNDQGWNIFKAIMLKEGISIKNTKIFPRNKDSEDIIDGKADAVITYITSQPTRLKAMGVDPAIMKPIDYGVDFYGDVVFTSRKFATDSPELVEAFNRATRRGWEYALKHKVKMAEYILTLPNVENRGITKTNLLEEANELEKLILPKFVEIGHMNAGRWQNMLQVYQDLNLASKSITLKNFLFEPGANKNKAWFDILVYTLTVGGILFIIAIVLNWSLRRRVLAQTSALRKENEERRKAEERLELAIEAAGLGLWELDMQNNTAHLNQRWIINQLGYEWDDSFQDLTYWDSLIHPDDKIRIDKINDEFIASNELSNSVTYRVKTSNGNWRWLLSFRKITSRDEEGKPVNITGMHLDIDSLKQKELELQEITKELLKKNSELEKFAYITSHNLRAPVVNLRSLTEMLHEDGLPEELVEEVNVKIRQSVEQLDSTLNDLVEIVSSKSTEEADKIDLNLLTEVNNTLLSIEKQVKDSGALIETDFTETDTIYFPKRYLTSILINLFTNAIKYRSADRKLIIRLKTQLTKNFVVLTFTDNGSGIDLERFQNKVFGLYQRFHTDVEGKGLGLYIVKSQIEAMDGKIELESVINQGTSFRIYFYNSQKNPSKNSVRNK
ncbi:MAG: ABC transporter substrate-binding protein [Daejeonella sp.]